MTSSRIPYVCIDNTENTQHRELEERERKKEEEKEKERKRKRERCGWVGFVAYTHMRVCPYKVMVRSHTMGSPSLSSDVHRMSAHDPA
jgi:hypothetical protein